MKEIDPIIIAVAKQYGFAIKPQDDGEGFHQTIMVRNKYGSPEFYWSTINGTVDSFFEEVKSYFMFVGGESARDAEYYR